MHLTRVYRPAYLLTCRQPPLPSPRITLPLQPQDGHLKDLTAAAEMYEDALSRVEAGAEFDLHYSRGLVLQELASKCGHSTREHRAYLEQVSCRRS